MNEKYKRLCSGDSEASGADTQVTSVTVPADTCSDDALTDKVECLPAGKQDSPVPSSIESGFIKRSFVFWKADFLYAFPSTDPNEKNGVDLKL